MPQSVAMSPQTTAVPSAPSRNNPISLRIYKALGTTFDDAATREALDIAAGFYTAPSKDQQGLGEGAIGKGGVNGDDSADRITFQRTLKGSPAAIARRCLKRDVERELAESSRRFLEAFGNVDQKLTVLRTHMEEMQVRCDQVQAELDQANTGTRHLLERADGLRIQRDSAQTRSKIINKFLACFTLSPSEAAALTDRNVELGPLVFNALDRLEQIRRDCGVLLGGTGEKDQAGLDILRATSDQQEAAFNKINRYCELQFRHYTREGQLDVSGVMREGVRRLRSRQGLFQETLRVLNTTRQSSLLQSFLDALTRGGPNGLPRPIEIHAHDPIRYVGDMLAWVHQATASEHEFLEGLFGVKERRRMVGQARHFGRAPGGEGGNEVRDGKEVEVEVEEEIAQKGRTKEIAAVEGEKMGESEESKSLDSDEEQEDGREEDRLVGECLDKHLDGLGRPLKMRIQQTVKSQEGLIMIYKISNLVQFYLITMRRTIGEGALLCTTLKEIHDQTYTTFLEMLDSQGRSLLRFLHPPDATLTPPLALRDAAHLLQEIIQVYSASLVDVDDRGDDFEMVLDKSLGPALEMCERMGEMRTSDAWDRDVFMINCTIYLQNSLEEYPYTEERVSRLGERVNRHVESMTFEHHGRLLDESGLASVMKTIRTRPEDTPLSRIPETSSKAITLALTQFSKFLGYIDVASSPRLSLLSSATLAETIHRSALRRIAEAYGEVCERVLDKKEGYEFAETLLRRGREEVEVALGVREV